MKNRLSIILLVIIAGVFINSCTTIINGTKQTVSLNSYPAGASVYVNGKSTYQKTPCDIEIARKLKAGKFNQRNEYNYAFRKEGYAEVNIQDYRRTDPMIYGNCLTTALAPFAFSIDFISGASNVYKKQINVELPKDNVKKDNTPPVITIVSPNINRGFKYIVEQQDVLVQLKIEDEGIVAFVSVNNIKLLKNEYGLYQVSLQLKKGINTINVKAIDNRDNVAHDVFVVELKDNEPEVILAGKENINLAGDFYALIIAVEDYIDDDISDLENPVNDAKRLVSILSEKYSFEQENINMLQNPNSNEITMALEYYFDNLSDNDNLLIFYAGHGFWDEKFKQGYWLPADANRNNRGSWIANSTVRDYMRGIPSKHSLLITDACFSGGIFKSRDAFSNASKAIKQLYALPSRKAMTSGALSVVPDKSVFVDYLIKRLKENQEEYLSSEQLFASFKLAVINNSPSNQVPQFGEVRETGDEGGDFIFIRYKNHH